jgi:hypothetical protein
MLENGVGDVKAEVKPEVISNMNPVPFLAEDHSATIRRSRSICILPTDSGMMNFCGNGCGIGFQPHSEPVGVEPEKRLGTAFSKQLYGRIKLWMRIFTLFSG